MAECERRHGQQQPRYSDSPSASANAVSFSRIDTVPDGASSNGAIIASAFLASRPRIIALTGPCPVADNDRDRSPNAINATAPIRLDAISPQSQAGLPPAFPLRT